MAHHTPRPARGMIIALLLVAIAVLSLLGNSALAIPQGPTITLGPNSNRTTANGTGPEAATKGSINYLSFFSTSQDLRWKAYVGNVTGSLVLQDASGYNIYSWPSSTTITGEVYASRNNTINWDSVGCALNSSIANEESVLGFTHGTVDSINDTFNSSVHTAMTIGTTTVSNCPTAYPYTNDTVSVGNDAGNTYQEILVNSTTDALIYATFVNDNAYSFHNGSLADFELILPDKGNTADTTLVPYYFYVELN